MKGQVNDKARLELILKHIDTILEFTKDTGSFESFEKNLILCHAVTYNVQCIGESVYRLSDDFKKKHPEVDWQSIEGMRHILVHDYYQVSFRFVWNVVTEDLGSLKEKVSGCL